ncbi:hypothetical protein [Streptomyces lavendulae]|uniref:hypothetical protein n=1 Tax=Streptomyces lavendulae TaxID=1914 RepID=UPI0024A3DF6E|nr:hypothetical protein [Streptomyces lavendulae]GLX19861.1 hypothetical protein Slala01_35050 [Streptomyces lavendulae subsp. lavendulae]GLX27358.1 hypothetical protein Slala02_31780 [Streptomyces lavendulae subsp. lavendulae]
MTRVPNGMRRRSSAAALPSRRNRQRSVSQAEGSRNSRWVAIAGISGALIGALTGVAGTAIGYLENNESRKVDLEQRQSDIRRKSYADLVAEFQTLKLKGNTVRNYIIVVANPESKESEEWKKQQWAKAGELYNKDFVEALNRSWQTVAAVNLVASDSARDDVQKFAESRDRMAELGDSILNGKQFDWQKFDKAVTDCQSSVEGFLLEVRDEVL